MLSLFQGSWCPTRNRLTDAIPTLRAKTKEQICGTRTAERRRAQDGYLAKLGLTDEQREKFRAHNVKLHEELAGLHEQREQAKAEYKKIMEQDAPDNKPL